MLCGILFGAGFPNDISLIRTIKLIGSIGDKTTIPLQIIGTGLFIIQYE